MNIVSDATVRQQALDAGQSFICEAPAGSGKTELLTQRLLTLLAQSQQPEEILAITFTRKAAAEMRERVLNALTRALIEPKPSSSHEIQTWTLANNVLQQDKQQKWQLLETPNRLQILTFDSLCASLANSLPLHSSFATPPPVTDDPNELYQFAARHCLASLEDSQPWSASIATLLTLLDNNHTKLECLLASMLGQREAWLPIIGASNTDKTKAVKILEKNLQAVRQDSVKQAIQTIPNSYHQSLISLAAFAGDQLQRLNKSSHLTECVDLDKSGRLPNDSERGITQWLGLTDLLITSSDNWRRRLDRNIGFPSGDNQQEKSFFKAKKQQCLRLIDELGEQPGLLEALIALRHLPSAHYSKEQRKLLLVLLDVLPVLAAYLQLAFQQHNLVDFTEVSVKSRAALGLLGEPSELAMVLDYKIQHILVDEFQDTSPAQFELLKSLTAGWDNSDGRTLFCVGDAMQSIYSFRHANVGLFLQCLREPIGQLNLTPLRLSTNFRSQGGIVQWVNGVFSRAFPKKSDASEGAVSYSSSQAFLDKLPQRAVLAHGFAEGSSEHDEARTILDIICKSQQDNPEGTIAILVRNRLHASHITPLLGEAGLRYHAVDLEPLVDKIVVQDLMSLTHALIHPADRVAWLSLLRAPWCGLSLVDLEAITHTIGEWNRSLTLLQQLEKLMAWEASIDSVQTMDWQVDLFSTHVNNQTDQHLLTDDGRARLSRVLPVLQQSLAQKQRNTLRQWIEGTWLALGGPACVDVRNLKNAELYLSLLETLDTNTLLEKRNALNDAVAKLYAVSDPLSDGKLQIMTLHKAKGLEFDTVIIPGLHRSPRSPEPELLRWQERIANKGERQLLLAPITSSGNNTKDPIYHHLTQQEKHRQHQENKRLLYVGCTRARQYLHLLAQVKTDKKDSSRLMAPAKSSLLYCIWDAIQPELQLHQKAETEPDPSTVLDQPKPLKRLVRQWQMPELTPGELLQDCVPFHTHDNTENPKVCWQDPSPRHIGTLVHRILQHNSLEQLQSMKANQFTAEEKRWRVQLRQLGVPQAQLQPSLTSIRSALIKIITDQQNHWLFRRDLPEYHTEFSVSESTNKGSKHWIIDLLINDGRNTWIIDYKTSQPNPQEDTEVFILRELEAYRDTLLQYQHAVSKLGYQNIRSALYFPMLSRLTPIKPALVK